MNKQAIANTLKSLQKTMRKHSPAILTGIGIAGMAAAAVMAVRAGLCFRMVFCSDFSVFAMACLFTMPSPLKYNFAQRSIALMSSRNSHMVSAAILKIRYWASVLHVSE